MYACELYLNLEDTIRFSHLCHLSNLLTVVRKCTISPCADFSQRSWWNVLVVKQCSLIMWTRRPMMMRNITDYQNCADIVSADNLPPPPTALLARNHIEQVHGHPTAVTISQRNAHPSSLPTSPVRVPAPTANLSSPTDSYDSSALGKVCTQILYRIELRVNTSTEN